LQRGTALAVQLLINSAADDGPIAQIVRDGPDQLDGAGAEAGHIGGGIGKESFRGFAGFAGEDEKKLTAAAGAKEDARQSQLGKERARQHLRQKGDPLRLSGEQVFAGGTHGATFGGYSQKEFLRAQNFPLQQDLFGHRTLRRPLRNLTLSQIPENYAGREELYVICSK
jgi:hypothetical protein